MASEKLRTKHGIDFAKDTVRRLPITVRRGIPRKLRPQKIQQPRLRRACIGELVQIDGCEHAVHDARDDEISVVPAHGLGPTLARPNPLLSDLRLDEFAQVAQ